MLIDLFDEEKENPDDFVSFIVFEPASLRIPDNDLLLIGDQVTDLFSQVISSENFNPSLPDQILLNRLQRIEMMIDLLKSNNGLILTKFLNNIWRRYSFFSNLGELFISQKDLKRLVPDYKFNEKTILDRVIETDEDVVDNESDNKSDNESDNTSNESNEATSSQKS
tara:strand:- start:96122 stop:96622 length:501 start_codon:yes stop_codon:yes gene_type:complete